ncbi:hypothetical protein [Terrisporobacter sp.]|uniref:hypothetical protein n=1 Tax=Terrisporobacter sp. TaxID=1965305 RepID=UPI00289B2F92|nr:hypothetical protein [Terrisporobacter sp.]
MGVIINEIKDSYRILLHKVNEEPIGELMFSTLNSIKNSLNEVGQIELTVNKYYISQIGKHKKKYLYYDYIKNERMISLDGAFYVIKDIKEDTKNDVKTVTAYSKEKKLEKISISIEDLGFYLQDSDEEKNIFSLDDYMYEETGWRFGHIDDTVKYNDFSENLLIDEISYDENAGNLSVDGAFDSTEGNLQLNVQNKTPKMRWQESINTSWLDYLSKTISTQFDCYVYFDNKNQLVDLYDMSSFGENLNLALSYDNYIKSLEKSSSSSDLVTKLVLIGNEEECVIEDYTVTGTNYIENYSYYINNEEMSLELINALNKYNEMTSQRSVTWKTLRQNKIQLESDLTNKKNEELNKLSMIKVLKENYSFYVSKMGTEEDVTGTYTKLATETAEKIQICENESRDLYLAIQDLELQIDLTEKAIKEINILCQKKTATDENGNVIFGTDDRLLNELKKFISSETFSDDSYYDAEEMIMSGEKKLDILSKPTRTWDIDVEDFTRRLVSNKFRQQWKGVLGLGDIIYLLNKDDSEEFIYFVGYEKNYRSKSLSLTLSDKKESEEVVRYINDWLKTVKANDRLLNRNRRILNIVKSNRINIKRSEVR